MYLFISIAALAFGPVVAVLERRRSSWRPAVDGFVIGTIVGLVALVLLPHAVRAGGWAALGFAAVGALFPAAFERTLRSSRELEGVALAAGLLGIALHATADGAALAVGGAAAGGALAAAVILHRIPVGIVFWSLIRPKYGRARAWGALALIGIATVFGYVLANQEIGRLQGAAFGWFLGFAAGALAHVLLHIPWSRQTGDVTKGRAVWGGGALIGIAVIAIAVYV